MESGAENDMDMRKCAVIGCGYVGATSAFAIMEGGIFSEIVLIDVNTQKAKGEEMDLNHGMPLAKPARIYVGDYDDIADCALVIIAAGANQKAGETRIDLVHKNTAIFKTILTEIMKRNRDCILLIVTNPVDVLTYATLKITGFPPSRVIGSGTVLDTARFKYLIGEHLSVDARNVHALVVGEHGDTELAVWSAASVSGIPVQDMCEKCLKCTGSEHLKALFEDVRLSAYRIIEAKGATYYAVALAVKRIVEAIVRDERSVLTVSSLVSGQYGLHDVCLGLPSIVGKDGVAQILEIPMSDEEMKKLRHSANTLKEIIAKIDLTL